MLRGIEQRNELDPSLLLRDTRTTGQRAFAFFKEPANVAVGLTCAGLTAFLYPEISDLVFVLGVGSFLSLIHI